MAAAKPRIKRPLRRPPGKLTTDQVMDAMRASAGIAAHAADRLKVSRSTVCKFLKDHPELKDQVEDILDTRVDMAEGKLFVAIGKGDVSAIRYFLDNKGGKAGYGSLRLEITGKDRGPIKLQYRDVSHCTDAELVILEQAALAFINGIESAASGPVSIAGELSD